LITTYKGKGLMDEAEPLCLGGMGLSPLADKIVMPLIGEADAILLIGYDPIEMRIGWRNPWTDKQNVIEITPVTRTHAMHSANIVLRSDIAQTLKALAHKAPKRWPDGKAGAARKALKAAFARPANWGPHQVFQTLRDALPDGTVATADSGAHRILFSQMWECKAPRTLLQSSGLCTMACALPLAAGAKMGRANAPVLCVVGDAGLDMGAGELATLRDLKLPVIVCVLVDESLGLIELKQRGSQRPNLGVDFGSTDFAAVAKAYGGHGVAIRDVESLRSEIGDALTRESFTVLAVEIGARAYDGAF
jgi:acetolactate synthase-1/2/3 large subunit